MSITKQVTVWCDGTTADGHSCMMWRQEAGPASSARRHAKKDGWTQGPGGNDYCPGCSKKRSEESSKEGS